MIHALAKMFRRGGPIRHVTVREWPGRVDLIVRAHDGRKLLSVRDGCEGEPTCCMGLHLMVFDEQLSQIEVHLTYEEARELIRRARRAMRKWRREEDEREDAELLDAQADAAW